MTDFSGIWARRKYWLFPVITLVVLLALLLALSGGNAAAPSFLYKIF